MEDKAMKQVAAPITAQTTLPIWGASLYGGDENFTLAK